MEVFMSLSRSKRRKGKTSKRSRMLKLIMPALSGGAGEELAEAIEAKSPQKFKAAWRKLEKKLADEVGESEK